MARMDFGDIDFYFEKEGSQGTNENALVVINSEKFDIIKDKLFKHYQELCSKHQSISDYGILYEWMNFDNDKKSIEIVVPSDWQQHELFVLFLLQTKALSFLEIPGFHRHIPSHLNSFTLEAKEDFFRFSNLLLKEVNDCLYANWQVFTDGMYWSFGIEVSANNEGDFPNVDFSNENSSILFQTSLGAWSDPLQISPEEHVFAYIYEEVPSAFQDYLDVKEQIESIVLKQMKTSYLDEVYASVADISLDKESLSNLFSVEGFKVEQLKNINRSTSLLSNDMINIIFSEYETDVVKKALLQDGLLLFSVSNRTKGDLSKVEPEDREIIETEVKSGLLQLIFNDLRKEYDFDNKLVISPQFTSQN